MNLFDFLWQAYNGVFIASITDTASQGLVAVAALFNTVVGLSVVIFGALMLMGRITWGEIAAPAIKVLIISALLTPAYFNQYVRDFFINTAPDWIAQSLGLAQSGQSAAAEFGTIYDACRHMIAQARGQTGWMNVAASVEIGICQLWIGLCLVDTFVIFLCARVLVGLLVCVTPFVLPLFLFNTTRGVADWLVGKLIGLLLVYLLISVLIQITLRVDATFMHQLASTASLAQMIDTLFGIALVFSFGVFLTAMLVGIAVYLGGGVIFNARPVAAAFGAAAGFATGGALGVVRLAGR